MTALLTEAHTHHRRTRREGHTMSTTEPLKPGTIQFVTDGPPAHKSGRFVELEDHTGASIGMGRWEDRGNGLWALIVEPVEASAVEAVRELHKPYPVYEFDHTNGVWAVDRDGEKKQIATLCLECTSLDEMADLEDCCWEADQNTTYYPCQTITAITDALEVQG